MLHYAKVWIINCNATYTVQCVKFRLLWSPHVNAFSFILNMHNIRKVQKQKRKYIFKKM